MRAHGQQVAADLVIRYTRRRCISAVRRVVAREQYPVVVVLIDRDHLAASVRARVARCIHCLEVTSDRTPTAVVQVHRRRQLADISVAVVHCIRRECAVEQCSQLNRIRRIEIIRQLVAVDAHVVRCIAERTNLVLYQYIQPADVLVAAAVRHAQFYANAAVRALYIAAGEVNIVAPWAERRRDRCAVHRATYFDRHRTAVVVAALVDVRSIHASEALTAYRNVQLIVAHCVRLNKVNYPERTLDHAHVAAVVRHRVTPAVVAHRNARHRAVGARKDRLHYNSLRRLAYYLTPLVQRIYLYIRYDLRKDGPVGRAHVGYARKRHRDRGFARERRSGVRRRVLRNTPRVEYHRASHHRSSVVAHFDDLVPDAALSRVAPVQDRPTTNKLVRTFADLNTGLILKLCCEVAVGLIQIYKTECRLQERITRYCRAGIAIGQGREILVALQERSQRRHDQILHRRLADRDGLRAGCRHRRTHASAVLLVFRTERTRDRRRAARTARRHYVRYRNPDLAAVVRYCRKTRVAQLSHQRVECCCTARLLSCRQQCTRCVRQVRLRRAEQYLVDIFANQRNRQLNRLRSTDTGTVHLAIAVAVDRYAVRTCRLVAGCSTYRADQQRIALTCYQRQRHASRRVEELSETAGAPGEQQRRARHKRVVA